jgi:DNA-3-methyladenine glycosylase
MPKTCGQATLVSRDFYLAPPDRVSRKLLGKLLVRGGMVGRIVEVEAYFGASDPAAHAYAGKTARNAVIFGPPGHAYVYFVYGMHFCLNVTCEPEGKAGCVLFRALEPVCGMQISASGPGRLCKAFGITRDRDNAIDFTSPDSDLQIQDDGFKPKKILVSPRIGITKDPDRLARYFLADNRFVSKPPRAFKAPREGNTASP